MHYDIKQKPKRNGTTDPGYYIVPVYSQTVGIRDLTRRITRAGTLTSSDITAAVCAMSEEITSALRDGNKVRIEGIGTFALRLTTPKDDLTPDDKVARKIKVRTITFRPDRRFVRQMADITFTRTAETHTFDTVTSGEALLEALRKHFKNAEFLQRRDMEHIAHCRKTTASALIRTLEKDGYITNSATRRNPLYRCTSKLNGQTAG